MARVSTSHHLADLPLLGPGGEPIDLWRTIVSHGITELPPMRVDEATRSFAVTLRLPRGGARTVVVEPGPTGFARVSAAGRAPGEAARRALVDGVRHVLRFDEDLSRFYAVAADDSALAWATAGAGRMIRSSTVFEEVVKTICTTNVAWSATRRMVSALVEHLGERAPGAPEAGPEGRAFPTPDAMAAEDASFYRDVVRAGYRGAYLRSLAEMVASGAVEIETLGSASREEVSDDEVERRLLALPGVGPYAAAHVMMLIGRSSRLILDSWTRPTYARLVGRRTVPDATIVRRFRRYGPDAGLAFWLFLTRSWVAEEDGSTA